MMDAPDLDLFADIEEILVDLLVRTKRMEERLARITEEEEQLD